MSSLPAHPRTPYGESDFQRIRRNRWLYVGKTRFLRRLEPMVARYPHLRRGYLIEFKYLPRSDPADQAGVAAAAGEAAA